MEGGLIGRISADDLLGSQNLFNVRVPVATLTFQTTANVASDGEDVVPIFQDLNDGLLDSMGQPVSPGTLTNARVDRPADAWRIDLVAGVSTPVPGGSGVFTALERVPGLRAFFVRFLGSGSAGERGIYGSSAAGSTSSSTGRRRFREAVARASTPSATPITTRTWRSSPSIRTASGASTKRPSASRRWRPSRSRG